MATDSHASLGTIDPVAASALAAPEKLATLDLATGRRFTYADLAQRVGRCAAYFASALGYGTGARIAMLARNSADVLAVQFGAVRAGLIFVPINWRLTPAEVKMLALDCLPRLIIYDEEFVDLAEAIAGEAQCETLSLGSPFEVAISAFDPAPARGSQPDQPATLLYTSGTTGRPKGAIVTERNGAATGENFARLAHVESQSVFLCDPPLFHVVGLYAICRSTLGRGGALLFSDRFDPVRTLERLNDPALGVTHYMCVPQMAQALRNVPGFDGRKLARLVSFSTGGAPQPPPMILPWLEDGVPLADGYGMTEAGTVLGMPPREPKLLREKVGSAGQVAHLVETRIVRPDGGDANADEVGELWVRGPNVSPGYWNNPEATEASRAGAWLRTGDLVRRDAEGFFFLVDRAKDMFISGGENVYPAEIESALLELSGVIEVAVFGVADARWGEVGVAYVVASPSAALSEEAVIGHCRARLAGYKLPKHVVVAEAVPRTASGKVQKHVLKAEWLARQNQKA